MRFMVVWDMNIFFKRKLFVISLTINYMADEQMVLIASQNRGMKILHGMCG